MSRSRRTKSRVRIRRHAWQRAHERLPEKKISASLIHRHIDGALRAGVPVNDQGAIEVNIGDGRIAVCVPELYGGWSVVTFIDNSAEEDRVDRKAV